MHPVVVTFELAGRAYPLSSYAVFLYLGAAVAGLVALRSATRAGLDPGRTLAVVGVTGLGALSGALGLFALVTWLQQGELRAGLVFYGAVLLGLPACWLACRLWDVPLGKLLDAGTPALPLGHALGRVGCFFGGCCYGSAFDGPWAVRYDHPLAPAAHPSVWRHPTPLYEAAALLVLSAMFVWWRPSQLGRGRRFAAYLLAYALLRIALETLRGDALRGVWLSVGVSTSQLIAALVASAVVIRWRPRPGLALSAALWLTLSLGPLAKADALRDQVSLAPTARVAVQAGWYHLGSSEGDLMMALRLCRGELRAFELCQQELFDDELPRHRVYLPRFSIDATEVSRRAYRRCVLANVCPPSRTSDLDARLAHPDYPVSGVDWFEAQRFCRFVGGRLPTEAEWEAAARGRGERSFPWGRFYNSRLANHGSAEGRPDAIDGYRYAAPVRAFLDGQSAAGALQMAGNVSEWTADRYDERYYERASRIDPRGPHQGGERVVRGGSWRLPAFALRVTHRESLPPSESRPDLGFRCAYR